MFCIPGVDGVGGDGVGVSVVFDGACCLSLIVVVRSCLRLLFMMLLVASSSSLLLSSLFVVCVSCGVVVGGFVGVVHVVDVGARVIVWYC